MIGLCPTRYSTLYSELSYRWKNHNNDVSQQYIEVCLILRTF